MNFEPVNHRAQQQSLPLCYHVHSQISEAEEKESSHFRDGAAGNVYLSRFQFIL